MNRSSMPSAKRKPDTGRWIALLTAVPAVIAAGRAGLSVQLQNRCCREDQAA